MPKPYGQLNDSAFDAIEGDDVEEMLAGGADVDDLIEAGELDDDYESPEDREARRRDQAESSARFLERVRTGTGIEADF